MIEKANFLCEIGCEEIPAGYLPPAIDSIKKLLSARLEEMRIHFKEVEVYATPRRFAIVVSDMAEVQSEKEIELKGPSLKAAYDSEGKPSKALRGFLKGNGLRLEDIIHKKTDKGDYIFALKRTESKKTVEIIPDIINSLIRDITFPKRMRWSDKNISFPRPISYFLILFNDTVVPFQISGISSSNKTRGHFIQSNRMFDIAAINDYERLLEENGVIIDQQKRKNIITEELHAAASRIGGELVADEELLDTVTFLTESPYVVTCEFNREFLEIPDIVLVTEMKVHQKYFAVKDASGTLLPMFFAVSNNPPSDHIRIGNERVIEARFDDARFFFDEDRKVRLVERVDLLKKVLFHKDLGTIYDKVMRMNSIALCLSRMLDLEERVVELIRRALLLSKADLTTAMVFEFPSLQGKMGKIYSLLDGEEEAVANALDDQYKPRFQGDPLPDGMVSIVVSISEKIDNVFGSFSVGNIPKGSQDPYALRRQSSAVVEMLMQNEINLDLKSILVQIADHYAQGEQYVDMILDFIVVRTRTIFLESGLKHDEIDACLSVGYYDFFELYRRAQSVHQFRMNDNFSEMLLSFKRMNNILAAFRKEFPDYPLRFSAEMLAEDSEGALYRFFDERMHAIDEYIQSKRYQDLFQLLIEGKPVIDNFFDDVMVMTDDRGLRDNRLSLLENILTPFKNLLDFSKIAE